MAAFLFLLGLGVLTGIVVGGLGAWTLRRVSRVAAVAVLAVGVIVILASLVPASPPRGFSTIAGDVTGTLSVAVVAEPDAPLVVNNGNGTLENGTLALACPDGCTFEAGTHKLRGAPYAISATLEDPESPNATGNVTQVSLADIHAGCERVPILFAFLFPGIQCQTKCATVHRVDAPQSGRLRFNATTKCSP